MKKFKWWWGIGVVIIILLAVSTVRSCRITDSYSKLKGQYEEYRRIVEADAKIKDALIAKQNAAIAELDTKIASSTIEVGRLTKLIGQKDKELDDLRGTWASLSSECQFKLHELDKTWGDKYAMLEGIVVEKDTQIADWGRKYAAQVEISDAWKAQYEAEHTLRLSGETLLGKLETKYKVLKITSSFKTVAVVAAAGFIGYTLIRKGK